MIIGTEPGCSEFTASFEGEWFLVPLKCQSPCNAFFQAIRAIAFGSAAGSQKQIESRARAMKPNDLSSMSADELWALHEEISAILVRRLAEEKAALEQRLRQLKPEGGRGTFERAKRPYPQVLPKFRNPARPAETWSGRGKQPRWLTAQLRSGKKINDFLINPSPNRARRSSSGRKQRRA